MRLPEIKIRDDGYYVSRPRSGKQLTNFLIIPKLDGGSLTPSVYRLVQNGKTLETVEIPEEAWASRSKFIAVLYGIGNLGFFGFGPDLRLVKAFVLSEPVPNDGTSNG